MEGEALSVGVVTVALLTTRLTLVITGLPVAPAEVVVTVPLYVPAVKPAGLTETPTDPDVVLPLAGVAESHEPPVVVATAVVKFKAVPLLATVIVLAAGVVPPIVYA